MGVAAANALGAGAVMFYLGQYAFTNLCVFLAVIAATNATGSDQIAHLAGLHRRSPLLAVALFLGLMSLAGIPPLSGFFGKFQLFAAVIQRAQVDPVYYVLAAIGAGAVVISLYFYLNIGRAIYLAPAAENEQTPIPVSAPVRAGLVICLVAMIGLGVYQRPLVDASIKAVSDFALR